MQHGGGGVKKMLAVVVYTGDTWLQLALLRGVEEEKKCAVCRR